MTNVDAQLQKVIVDLPNHWASSAESMWAFQLENGTYQIDNIPFYAYGINYNDIVRVDASGKVGIPVVVEVVAPSGHQTIRVIFPKNVDRKKQEPVIEELEKLNVYIERAFSNFVALDIPPEVDYEQVRGKLNQLESDGILEYETCEPRFEGRFDEGPANENEGAS